MTNNLSRHFTATEFESSQVARDNNLQNVMNVDQRRNAAALCRNVLEPLREAVGSPLIINSGFRGTALNSFVGGVPNSQHTLGEAADVSLPKGSGKTIMELCASLIALGEYHWAEYDQMILEVKIKGEARTEWLHASYKRKSENRMQALVQRKQWINEAVRYETMTRAWSAESNNWG